MNNRVLFGASLLLVIALLVSCGTSGGEVGLADGTYEGVSDPGPRGYVRAVLTVSGGDITDARLHEYTGDGSEKDPESYTFELWAEAAEELPQQVVAAQSVDIDGVAGATSTTDKFKQAVQRALGEEDAYEEGPFNDGVYQAESDVTERGGRMEVQVTVLLGTIVDVQMTEYDGDGNAKTKDNYDFEAWHTAVDTLPGAVVERQSADVDIVASATSTSNMFIQAVERAIEMAS